MDKQLEKNGWYPGKYYNSIKQRRQSSSNSNSIKSSSSSSSSSQKKDYNIDNNNNNNNNNNNDDIDQDCVILDNHDNEISTGGWKEYTGSSLSTTTTSSSSSSSISVYSEKLKYGSKLPKSIGLIKITISSAKYLSVTKSNISLHVEGSTKTFRNVDDDAVDEKNPIYHEFNFIEITSDILITLSDDSFNYIGRIVIPITSLIGIFKTKPATSQTYQFFPLSPNYEGPIELGRLQSGLKELPSVAMTKDKKAIGFITAMIEVQISEPCWKLYLNSPYVNSKSYIAHEQTTESTKRLKAKELIVSGFRELQRITRLAALPKVFLPITNFPQVLVVIIVYAFISFWIKTWQFPFLLLGLVFMNGLVSSGTDRFGYLMIWNNCIPVQYPFSRYFEDILNIDEKFINNLEQLLLCINGGIDGIEMLTNMTNFSDPCVSYLFYTSCLLLSFVISFLLTILSFRFVIVLIGTLIMIAVACRSALFNFMSNNNNYPSSSSSSSSFLLDALESALVFWLRIPTDLVLEHRLIAKSAIVKYGGIEMQDAAEFK